MSRLADRALAPRRSGLWLPDRRIVAPKGIGFGAPPASAIQGGAPAVPISFVDSIVTTSTSLDVPGAHAAGDLVLIACFRADSTTPNLPTGATSILTVTGGSSGGTISARLAYKYCADDDEQIAGISGSTRSILLVFRGTHPSAPIGDVDDNTGNGTTATLDELSLAASSSVVAAFVRSASGTTPSAPSGMTAEEAANASGSSWWAGWIGPTGSFAARTSSVGNARWLTMNVELLAA